MFMPGSDMREIVNVLVVEDDDIDVELLRRLFDKQGIQNPIYRAANGLEALRIIQGEHDKATMPRPFIVLLDINMPLMNGIELLRVLRSDESLKDTVVFILTSSPREEDIQTTYKLNVAGYFLKKDVKELISMLSLYWQLNEFPESK